MVVVTVIFRMMLRRFAAVMGSVRRVTMSRMRMMRCPAVITVIVVFGGFVVMFGCLLVMISGRAVVLSTFVIGHEGLPLLT